MWLIFIIIGLPSCEERHFLEFEKVWSKTRRVNPRPVTLLMTLVDTLQEAEQLCMRWKLSNIERNLGYFIVSKRYFNIDDQLKPYQDMIVSVSNLKNTDIRQHVQELLYYEGKLKASEEISQWTVPTFPITGKDLKDNGIKPGPEMGKILAKLKELWMESDFMLSKANLLIELKNISYSVKK